MKNILMVSPTSFEIKAAKDISYKKVVLGVGPVSSAIKLTQLLERDLPSAVILFGVCGAYPDSGLSIGDVVIARKEIFVDIARCFQDKEEQITVLTQKDVVFDLQEDIKLLFKDNLLDIPIVNFATVCCSTMYKDRAYRFKNNWDANVENMEGASVAKVCKLYNIPLLEIRGVSNIVCDPIELWQIDKAIDSMALFLKDIVRIL